MTDEPAYMRNLRAITRADPKLEHLEALEQELYASTSSRATVVMFGSFVETSLERLLASVLRENLNSRDRKQIFEYEGAMGTFSSKIVDPLRKWTRSRPSVADLGRRIWA